MGEPTRQSARFVVARIVLLRDLDGPLPWVAAVDAGWRPDNGLGPWVGGAAGQDPAAALSSLAIAHEREFIDYARRVGHPVDG